MIPIVSPSYRRADRACVERCFPPETLTYCVAESEAGDYAEYHPGVAVVAHPDEVVGIAATRQWIYEYFGDVIMVDDDIVSLIHMEHAKGDAIYRNGKRYSQHHLEPEEAALVMWRLAEEARQAGCYLFGVNPSGDPRNYKPMSPLRMTGYVDGSLFGILAGSKLSYNPHVVAVDDFWISCLNAFHHRKALIDYRYGVVEDSKGHNFANVGGLGTQRSTETERGDTELLKQAFGPIIQPKKAGARSKGVHDYQRTMKLPF